MDLHCSQMANLEYAFQAYYSCKWLKNASLICGDSLISLQHSKPPCWRSRNSWWTLEGLVKRSRVIIRRQLPEPRVTDGLTQTVVPRGGQGKVNITLYTLPNPEISCFLLCLSQVNFFNPIKPLNTSPSQHSCLPLFPLSRYLFTLS